MSGERQDCAATVFDGRAGSSPCYRKGPFKEGGKFWCFQHAPSKVAERCAQAAKKYDDEWKARDAAELQAENKIWNDAVAPAAELAKKPDQKYQRGHTVAAAIRKLKKP